MKKDESFLEKTKKIFENNKIYVFVLLFGGAVIGVINFLDTIKKGISFFEDEKKPTLVDISIEEDRVEKKIHNNAKKRPNIVRVDSSTKTDSLIYKLDYKNENSAHKKRAFATDIKTIVQEDNYITYSTIDIKLRNPSKETIFIKEARINVKKMWKLYNKGYRCPAADGFAATGSYKVDIDFNAKAPFVFNKKISQEVKSNSVDRFLIEINDTKECNEETYVIYFNIDLIYNEDDKFLTTKDIILIIKPECFIGCTGDLITRFDIKELESYKHYDPEISSEHSLLYKWRGKDIRKNIIEYYKINYKNVKEILATKAIKKYGFKWIIDGEDFKLSPDTLNYNNYLK